MFWRFSRTIKLERYFLKLWGTSCQRFSRSNSPLICTNVPSNNQYPFQITFGLAQYLSTLNFKINFKRYNFISYTPFFIENWMTVEPTYSGNEDEAIYSIRTGACQKWVSFFLPTLRCLLYSVLFIVSVRIKSSSYFVLILYTRHA